MKFFYHSWIEVSFLWVCMLFLPLFLPAQSSNIDIFDYRTIDGSFNDLRNHEEGKAGNNFIRMHDKSYYFEDGSSMVDRGNVRHISNQMFNQYTSRPDPNQLSSMVFTFLQFLDHDITLTQQGNVEFTPISIPEGDPHFDPFSTGKMTIPFTRVAFNNTTTQRHQINEITAWIDASNVYGSEEARAAWLRSGDCGKLKVSPSPYGDLLPCNTTTGNCNDPLDVTAPFMDHDRDRNGQPARVFVAGDLRANEQPGLTALHTLFVREHNRICDQLAAQFGCDDEANYQRARKIVGGLLQNITYNELLPILGINFDTDKYDRDASGDINNSFATAAYRLGHTMITEDLPFVYGNCEEGAAHHMMSLKDAFFNFHILFEEGIDPVLSGVAAQTQEAIDPKVVGAVRNFLFGPPGAGGLDLAALNIQRGRDHGLPDYNSLRLMLGLPYARSFEQIAQNYQIAATLEDIYDSTDNVDAWVGMLSEPLLPGKSVGETIHALLSQQFNSLRTADRFYYTRDPILTDVEKSSITNTSLADIINRNTSLSHLKNVFINTAQCLPSSTNSQENIVECNEVIIKHEDTGLVSIQGVHGVDYAYEITKDPMGLAILYKCPTLCGDSFNTTLPVGTHYVTVRNVNNKKVCEARISIKPLPSGLRITPVTSSTLSVFPNPAREVLNIVVNLPTEKPTQLYIFNALGQVVHTAFTSSTATYPVNVAHLPKGIYEVLVQSQSSGYQMRQKVSIQ